MKFKEAWKFSDYKYNLSDVQLYTDSIKTLDSFSGFYISEWLTSLTFIINDLLKNINQSIELTDNKEFIKMKDNGQELYYSDLSSGQRTFLSAVFKLSILLQKGESNRIIIADDGFGALDEINFKNFVEVCKNIPMQFFLVFQDIPIIEGVNYTNIERKNNESRII
jgi:wobble nucleotide-excising tRNase